MFAIVSKESFFGKLDDDIGSGQLFLGIKVHVGDTALKRR